MHVIVRFRAQGNVALDSFASTVPRPRLREKLRVHRRDGDGIRAWRGSPSWTAGLHDNRLDTVHMRGVAILDFHGERKRQAGEGRRWNVGTSVCAHSLSRRNNLLSLRKLVPSLAPHPLGKEEEENSLPRKGRSRAPL